MYLLFEEGSQLSLGKILSQQNEHYQVETSHGKRIKVRAKDILEKFSEPKPEQVMDEAQALQKEIDPEFLWEVAGTEEFAVADLAKEYFGGSASVVQIVALLMQFQMTPFYFHKKGKGIYRCAPKELVEAALKGLEKRRLQDALKEEYIEQLKNNQLPDALKKLLPALLYKPDKNSVEYKALEAAALATQRSAAELLFKCGAFASEEDLHLSAFLFEYFPRGTQLDDVPLAELGDLPITSVEVFSIDDESTTEIDDAFSVTAMDATRYRIGIHIAAPALGIKADDEIDKIAQNRLSTVYMPGNKITMLPNNVIDAFTLKEGVARPAVSLYVEYDISTGQILATNTVLEKIIVTQNLRHQTLDAWVNSDLMDLSCAAMHRWQKELAVLWHWSKQLAQGRAEKRAGFGLKPEQSHSLDYQFTVDRTLNPPRVHIEPRVRGSVVDTIVAELMIFANQYWGAFLAQHNVAGIYRSQSGWGARMQVRMSTKPAPHQSLGVDQYIWSTSPLRRYTDLINQWQLLACVQNGVTAPLVAPFKAQDSHLLAMIAAFDATYTAYHEFQNKMERYWSIYWLGQQQLEKINATVWRSQLVKLDQAPLFLPVFNLPEYTKGTKVLLHLREKDFFTLNVGVEFVKKIEEETVVVDETVTDTEEDDRSDVTG